MPLLQSSAPHSAGYFDLVRDGRVIGGGDGWTGVVATMLVAGPGVYTVVRADGMPVAVATFRADGTWLLQGGKRNG